MQVDGYFFGHFNPFASMPFPFPGSFHLFLGLQFLEPSTLKMFAFTGTLSSFVIFYAQIITICDRLNTPPFPPYHKPPRHLHHLSAFLQHSPFSYLQLSSFSKF